jgi:hypothetical protein
VGHARWLSNGAIAATLISFAVSLPPLGAVHARLREKARSGLATLGLRTPEWRLFGPNVHKTNSALSAEVTLADGTLRRWTSPEFGPERSAWRRFREGQLPKFYDNLRRDRHRQAWRPFSAWVANEVAPGESVVRVRLARTVTELAPPGAPRTREAQGHVVHHVFYERRFR